MKFYHNVHKEHIKGYIKFSKHVDQDSTFIMYIYKKYVVELKQNSFDKFYAF